MEGRNIIGLALLSAALLLAAFPPLNLWWLSFFACVPLFFGVISQTSTKGALKLGLVFGFIFMAGFHSWMLELRAWGPTVGVIIMWLLYSLYLSLFYAALTATLHKFKQHVWSFPIIWTVFEYIKSISVIGNPAGTTGYALGFVPLLNQVSSLTGVFGISCLIITLNILFLYAIKARKNYAYTYIIGSIVVFGIWTLTGYLQYRHTLPPIDYKTVSIIQPNHSQEKKLNKYDWTALRIEHLSLIKKTVLTEKPTMIFLPETITPGLNTQRSHFMGPLTTLSNEYSVGIFFGTPIKQSDTYFNAIALMTPEGLSKDSYNKVQLMPFGEYWPAKSVFKSLGLGNIIPGSEFTSGKGFWPLRYETTEVGSLVCLESIYPWFSKKLVNHNAMILYVAANNAWFFNSSAAQKHLQMSTLRAIETHRTLIHATNTGLSAFISPKGHISQKTKIGTQAILTKTVPLYTSKTLYTVIGEAWLVVVLILCCAVGLYKRHLEKVRES